jgi:hypothetical protein
MLRLSPHPGERYLSSDRLLIMVAQLGAYIELGKP